MKRIFALMLALCLLLSLTACGGTPLVATATPAPTPTPTPEPTPEPTPTPFFAENVIWPETSLTKLLPAFQPTLEVASQQGDEFFFCAFSESDPGVINRYIKKLEEMGFTVNTETGSGLFTLEGEVEGQKLNIQLFYDNINGTLQVKNESISAK